MRRRGLIGAVLAVGAGALAGSSRAASKSVRVRLVTDLGVIVLGLRPDVAPVTAGNFLRYLDRGLWKGATFYRTVGPANDHNPATITVIQGGLNKDDAPLGGIAHETTAMTGLKHVDGAISMARGAPGTAGADFFICLGANPALDFGGARNPDGQGFAVFGRVLQGMDVVRAIHDRPTTGASPDGYTAGQILADPVRILKVERL
jgi:peptidyl-prolyl cis-trans isomerase A (cyclophilin A)